MAELVRHDVLSEGREEEEAAECCRARLARDGGSVARPRPAMREGVGRGLWWGVARGQRRGGLGRVGELQTSARRPRANRRIADLGEEASGESENRYYF